MNVSLNEIINVEILFLILEYFDNDLVKTITWFTIKNPSLGNVKPIDMIKNGRSEKLIKFIENQLEGNSP